MLLLSSLSYLHLPCNSFKKEKAEEKEKGVKSLLLIKSICIFVLVSFIESIIGYPWTWFPSAHFAERARAEAEKEKQRSILQEKVFQEILATERTYVKNLKLVVDVREHQE